MIEKIFFVSEINTEPVKRNNGKMTSQSGLLVKKTLYTIILSSQLYNGFVLERWILKTGLQVSKHVCIEPI